jgi:hypothetical protein
MIGAGWPAPPSMGQVSFYRISASPRLDGAFLSELYRPCIHFGSQNVFAEAMRKSVHLHSLISQ